MNDDTQDTITMLYRGRPHLARYLEPILLHVPVVPDVSTYTLGDYVDRSVALNTYADELEAALARGEREP